MKPLLAVGAGFVTMVFISSCSQGQQSRAASADATSSENVEQVLLNLHAEWGKAPLSGDTSVFERILAPDFVYILDDPEQLGEGRTFNKQEYIAYEAIVGKDINKYSTAENQNLKVRVYGRDIAVSTGDFYVTGSDQKGKEFERISRWINVWVRRDGSWQAVAAQNTWFSKK